MEGTFRPYKSKGNEEKIEVFGVQNLTGREKGYYGGSY